MMINIQAENKQMCVCVTYDVMENPLSWSYTDQSEL